MNHNTINLDADKDAIRLIALTAELLDEMSEKEGEALIKDICLCLQGNHSRLSARL